MTFFVVWGGGSMFEETKTFYQPIFSLATGNP